MTHSLTHTPPLPALSLAGSAKFARIFSRALLLGFILLVIAMFFLPWRQFVSGTGRVIAFNPLDRRINVEAQVSGRVKHLHVVEGQRVKKGEIIAEIQDNDPNLLNNLRAQREAIESRRDFAQGRVESLIAQITQQELAKAQAIDSAQQRVAAAKIAAETSMLNFTRTEALFAKGLASKRDHELATLSRDSTAADLKSAEATLKRTSNDFDATIASTHASKGSALSEVAAAERDLSGIDIQINQNLRQVVEAPRDGIVLQVAATDGTYLRPGSLICVVIPETDSRFVEIWLDGNDMPLIHARHDDTPGSPVRLAFEGWPAVQMIGWPQLAVGTFGGEVVFVDATDDGKGKFRVVVGPQTDIVDRGDGKGPVEVNWPDKDRWLRQGVRTNAWVMLNEVPLWFELWRQINGFPPIVSSDADKLDPSKK
ncbi:HlyD family efflux transporter periplasmic adaptor subunit [Prosthecobacter sp.]|uniref:HlyD family secretion protein n=1 Tax=Prosthecobacter sp. TaxID=1965333 RepID=UPI001DF6BEFC|nr:HlyD family efflux transporter periplasmic adaptor subunit [Prosthecobacter sp.]MCB1279328.1 HlyD family efflux transporter periplasmic adaptor subunit [Prosthecobacter sp.]